VNAWSSRPAAIETPQPAGPEGVDLFVVEAVAGDPPLALQFGLARLPDAGRVLVWACCARPARPLLTLVEPDLALPRGLEVRGPGLWADLQCLVPFDHVTLGVEAFAIGLDDPEEARGRAWGERVPFGLDLEWDTVAPATSPTGAPAGTGVDGYELACRVHGELLVGDERLELDALGSRRHLWGAVVPWAVPWARVVDAGGARTLTPEDAAAHVAAAAARGDVLAEAPMVVPPDAVPGRPGFRLDRTLVRVQDAGRGGDAAGVAWIERSAPW
jgi:hypothetical protein